MILVKKQIRDDVWELVSNRVWGLVYDQFRIQIRNQIQIPIGYISIQIRSKINEHLEKHDL